MDASDLLRYWHAVELLQPQTIPDLKIRDKDYQAYIHDMDDGGPFPWDPLSLVARQPVKEGRIWSHLVYAHWFRSARLDAVLRDVFGEEQGYREPQDRDIALFAVRFTADGRFVPDSLVLSSAAWMLGRVVTGQPWKRGFDVAQQAATDLATQCFHGEVDAAAFARLNDVIVGLVGLMDFFEDDTRRHRVLSTVIDPKNAGKPNDDPLNSFILDDLADIAEHIGHGTTSEPLRAYLKRHDGAERIDVTHDALSERLIRELLPSRHPSGCWPTEEHRGLVHAQQLAVNRIVGELRHGAGLLSVNGPPGTGKTTMLRDIVAAAVTHRADVLASLPRASDAFVNDPRTEVETTQDGTKKRYCYRFKDALFGHEIVVASSNNGAVENVTMELPQRDKVDASWLEGEEDHFSDLAGLLAGQPAWGLVSAKLGAKRNRTDFIDRFYWGSGELPPRPAGDDTPAASKKAVGFKEWLKLKADVTWTTEMRQATWTTAVTRYKAAVTSADAMIADVATLGDRLSRLGEARRHVASCRDALAAATTAHGHALREMHSTVAGRDALRAAMQACMDRVAAHERTRPGFLENLMTLWGAWRRWSAIHEHEQRALRLAEGDLAAFDQRQRQAHTVVQDAAARVASCTAALDESEVERERQRTELLGLALGCHAAHLVTWLQTDGIGRGEAIELAEPWQIPGWRKARAHVFMEALRLQRTFFEIEAKRMQANMDFAMAILAGGNFRSMPREAIRSAWATLFMAVPVLSSTFASFARTFRTLEAGDIGWLLVDEAGQATPQAAVGALWRARRAVMVGDPLQLKPVLTVPGSVLEHMRNAYALDAYWIPAQLSAQGLADEANPMGRQLGPAGMETWVGLPLVVHRRCDRPMFELSNRIAYQGAMVYGTLPPKTETPARLPTGWIDVRGPSGDNWVPAEGDALRFLLQRLAAEGVQPADVSVITPFKDVREQLGRFVRAPMVGGTIHTMQGKESSVVIVVLGGRSDAPGARDWAVSELNLLNVAATRAKRRLYIIGDRADWCSRSLFHEVIDLLPSLDPTTDNA